MENLELILARGLAAIATSLQPGSDLKDADRVSRWILGEDVPGAEPEERSPGREMTDEEWEAQRERNNEARLARKREKETVKSMGARA